MAVVMTGAPDFEEAVRAWLKSREGIVSTHYTDCWKYHADCVATWLLRLLDAEREKAGQR